KAHLKDGRPIDFALCDKILNEELTNVRRTVGDAAFEAGKHRQASQLLIHLIEPQHFIEFLTLPAYDQLKSFEVAPAHER
ncbi:MAG TPA: hypothetical protein VNO32_36310, partial [Candidatus Acidoferrum sp.]|nr:hypothetical protein [Candidatus Acidoferrum sp.]